jgi:hypothetical protein
MGIGAHCPHLKRGNAAQVWRGTTSLGNQHLCDVVGGHTDRPASPFFLWMG